MTLNKLFYSAQDIVAIGEAKAIQWWLDEEYIPTEDISTANIPSESEVERLRIQLALELFFLEIQKHQLVASHVKK